MKAGKVRPLISEAEMSLGLIEYNEDEGELWGCWGKRDIALNYRIQRRIARRRENHGVAGGGDVFSCMNLTTGQVFPFPGST